MYIRVGWQHEESSAERDLEISLRRQLLNEIVKDRVNVSL